MITQRVRGEMFNAKGHLLQIEIYTNRKRFVNRLVNFLIVFFAVLAAISMKLDGHQNLAFISALVVAVASIAKECLPLFLKPEDDLRELDRLYDFYTRYLLKLETLYIQRYMSKKESDVNDPKMLEMFVAFKESEGGQEADLNRLCRHLYWFEKKKIKKYTKEYFDTHLPGEPFNNDSNE